MPKINNYINNTDLLYNTILSKGLGYPNKHLVKMFIQIVDGISLKFRERNSEIDLEDMKQQALLRLLETYTNFSEKKYNNALAFFSEIVKRSFAEFYNTINGIKTYKGVKTKLQTISMSRIIIFGGHADRD